MDSSPHTKHMFYWMVYADGVPAEQAPTVLWLTGGPGCSSLYAFMTEHGPLHNSGNGTLVQNPYSWNKAPANIVYLEAPVSRGPLAGKPAASLAPPRVTGPAQGRSVPHRRRDLCGPAAPRGPNRS